MSFMCDSVDVAETLDTINPTSSIGYGCSSRSLPKPAVAGASKPHPHTDPHQSLIQQPNHPILNFSPHNEPPSLIPEPSNTIQSNDHIIIENYSITGNLSPSSIPGPSSLIPNFPASNIPIPPTSNNPDNDSYLQQPSNNPIPPTINNET
ncbi:uncharacterized protein LOC125769692 [Anopheles funestus]|uniref:uncharacterized protein LOC125769692 n=1 Tax=Anopheles funestus TaxID=62324 RepID=UPI0020C5C8A6|nr:uncharacterized protein LOC125769692 [Anopheles funestus]